MNKDRKEHRDRLVVLSFVSILLMLVYGPAASWFVAADRVLYDRMASALRPSALEDAVILSIDPRTVAAEAPTDAWTALVRAVLAEDPARIVLTQAPERDPDGAFARLAAEAGNVPLFVPRGHPLARNAKSGFFVLTPDGDGIQRRSPLWRLEDGVKFPSLALAIAMENGERAISPTVADSIDAVYLSGYAPLPRYAPDAVTAGSIPRGALSGKTVFIDAEPPLVGAVATLPTGQHVTRAEMTAALLADLTQDRMITAPAWVGAMEWLAPAMLAIVAVLFIPGRKRREIVLLTLAGIAALLLLEAALLAGGRLRLDLGRPLLIFAAAGALTWWLAGVTRKAAVDAFRRGSDFLAAGRLEPAFAEFRRCEPSETLAAVMYKLSLAFEGQAKPERAEAVLQWLKSTQEPRKDRKAALPDPEGAPQRLGRYVIEKKLGRGAMGAVYLARDPRINRPIALKVIPIEKEFEDEELEEARLRFFREAESAGRLAHPNIITVFDAGEDKHLAYIAMEYLPGVQLKYYTDPKRLLAPRKALELCARTADALDYAHNQGVIHRDIKPANLLYNLQQDLLKISDFGVARLTDNNRTKSGIVLGTPMYMSPEQLAADPLSGHSDLFSLGVTLYELLTGTVPFKATNIAVLMTKITSEDPVPVSNRRPGIPPSVDAVLAKALAKRPEQRFANGGEMAIALRNCAAYAAA